MAWKDVNEAWHSDEVLEDWIDRYPRSARRAAALALSVVKWNRKNFSEAIRDSSLLCGACAGEWTTIQLWTCTDYPLWRGENEEGFMLCCLGDRKAVYDRILRAYAVEWEKLPVKWKEKSK